MLTRPKGEAGYLAPSKWQTSLQFQNPRAENSGWSSKAFIGVNGERPRRLVMGVNDYGQHGPAYSMQPSTSSRDSVAKVVA